MEITPLLVENGNTSKAERDLQQDDRDLLHEEDTDPDLLIRCLGKSSRCLSLEISLDPRTKSLRSPLYKPPSKSMCKRQNCPLKSEEHGANTRDRVPILPVLLRTEDP